ncbi:hypothetical protein TNCV_2704491 [Trichonephila clavipes]|nr:hypothetical protein TNCV_2704491 [Trichonephila clavipes]
MRVKAYYAHLSIRDHWALRYMSRCPDQVVSLKRNPHLVPKSAALTTIHERYPYQDWLRVFADASATDSFGRARDGAFPNYFNRKEPFSAWVEGVACFRVISGHDYLHAHLLKIDLADSPLCPLCKSVPMTGEHLSDYHTPLYVFSQDNSGALPPVSTISDLY